jgi:uncharacterized protein YbjT (DUF2867 family)
MKRKTALVFGATGLVGTETVRHLLEDEAYEKVVTFVRRDQLITHPKLISHRVQISDIESYKELLTGDDLFISLGTTIKKAGSIQAMEIADRDVPAAISVAARGNGVKAVAVVSSIGANVSSRNYYLRIKGEMERAIIGAGFDKTIIVRPSILLGKRAEFRFGEAVGKVFMKTFRFIFSGPLRKYRGIEASDVAASMITLINSQVQPGQVVFESDELFPNRNEGSN